MKKQVPDLGSIVDYARTVNGEEIVTGKGRVQCAFLNTEKRIVIQLADVLNPSDAFNVDLAMINANSETIEAYKNVLQRVKIISQDGNEKCAKIIEEYNAMVAVEYASVLGEGLDFQDENFGTN